MAFRAVLSDFRDGGSVVTLLPLEALRGALKCDYGYITAIPARESALYGSRMRFESV